MPAKAGFKTTEKNCSIDAQRGGGGMGGMTPVRRIFKNLVIKHAI
jgi:hypothetical protein